MDINEKLANLTAEQSKALAASMNAAYNKQPDTDDAEPEDDEQQATQDKE